jgi:hypothetical protein
MALLKIWPTPLKLFYLTNIETEMGGWIWGLHILMSREEPGWWMSPIRK